MELDLLSHQARQYVLNLVDIEKKRVKDVMLPWEQVILPGTLDSEAVFLVLVVS